MILSTGCGYRSGRSENWGCLCTSCSLSFLDFHSSPYMQIPVLLWCVCRHSEGPPQPLFFEVMYWPSSCLLENTCSIQPTSSCYHFFLSNFQNIFLGFLILRSSPSSTSATLSQSHSLDPVISQKCTTPEVSISHVPSHDDLLLFWLPHHLSPRRLVFNLIMTFSFILTL